MRNVAYILCLLMLIVSGCLATKTSNSSSVTPKSEDLSNLKKWKQTLEEDIKKNQKEKNGWNKRICDTALVSSGKSPIGPTHMIPGQDPTDISGWRDPITKGDAEDNFIEAKIQVERLEDAIKAAEKELSETNRKINELERIEQGGGGNDGGGGSGGGGGGSGGGGC